MTVVGILDTLPVGRRICGIHGIHKKLSALQKQENLCAIWSSGNKVGKKALANRYKNLCVKRESNPRLVDMGQWQRPRLPLPH
jgi:hypothetical protein